MSDTSLSASSFRHPAPALRRIGLLALVAGLILRVAAAGGELWLDEIWSLLKVTALSNPIEIVTTVKHDNNHILNSAWMWICGATQAPLVYRAPSLIFSALLLCILLLRKPEGESARSSMLWLSLVAFSYPLTLYGTEARGYSLTLLCAAVAFLALTRLTTTPTDRRAIITFSIAGVIGCLSHAIYALFLAPAVAWLLWRLVSSTMKANSREILWGAIVPPVFFACWLTLTFYRNMEIGGAPLLPYLEVAASAVSVSFGGKALSSINPAVTGWNLFLAISMILVCVAELVSWIRGGSPIAWLVGLIILTPWVAVSVLQPHFILPRYFIIQIFFAYLLAARFLTRLAARGRFGGALALILLGSFILANTSHTLTLARVGRSHFVAIFQSIASQGTAEPVSVGGDQDFQNKLRLNYARIIDSNTSRIDYVTDYRNAATPPRYVLRETLEGYEIFLSEIKLPQGARYHEIRRYRAPQLNGSHVTVYELTR